MDNQPISISPTDIINNANQLLNQTLNDNESKGLFTVKPANKWIEQAKVRPTPEKLFDSFWYEGEVCILFADTNLGKSILAVQIGDSISKGLAVNGFQFTAKQQPILYFDFELSDKQFEIRYSQEMQNHYSFSDDFIRVEINPDADFPEGKSFEDYLNTSLEKAIVETGVKVLIIDNLTYLRSENEKAKDALPLMKHLKALKRKYGLSILALAHTPKRDATKQLSRNDLQGSKMLMNFCDSSFAIGESFIDKSFRYIKQIKQRNTEEQYGSDNVIICQLAKPSNFLKFDFLNYAPENEHLKQVSEKDKTELENNIKALLEQDPSMSAYAIAKKLCTNDNSFNSFKVKVSRIIKRLGNNGNT